ncbi:MAG: radical SAM protein [Thermodesulfobacteriota bacterium]
MRAVLAFPPHASPTYVPLGVAALVGHARARCPSCDLTARDLNLTAWERVAQALPGGSGFVAFLRGREGNFFDRCAYAFHQETWRAGDAAFARLCGEVKAYLDAGQAPLDLLALLDALADEVLGGDPELVGVSLLALGQLPWALALARRVRERAPALALCGDEGRRAGPRIVFGGAACSALQPEELLAACPFVDGVVLGEGEAAWEALCRGLPDREVPDLAYRSGGGVARNRPAPAAPLEALALPDFSALPLERYFNPSPVLPVLASRGCKWRRCRFCAHTTSFGGYRAPLAARCARELEALHTRYGARHFYFADLYVDAPDLAALSDELRTRGCDLSFHALGRPTADYTPARLETLAAAGCRWISWGVESGSQRLLDVAGKGTRVETVEAVLRDAHAAGVSNLAMMIYGLPTSGDEDLGATLAFLERVYPHVGAFTASAFALFEGTGFARRAERYGLIPRGRQEEVRVAGKPIHSTRLDFRERAADGSARPPRGTVEVGEWVRRRRWLGEVPFLEGIACEHYLLHVSPHRTGRARPPVEPPRRAA